ncbi:HutD family protein [Aquincola sp. MAHUQ-54]|uniref:HutD family protein n=1 Tax=Aquincola agrisoli TaxID=3119538 RepID=A0AAW9Q7R8_9BURK
MTASLIPLHAQAPLPWRNGGGHTRELLRRPAAGASPQDDGWALRISVADVERDGDFSAFPGVQRWFAMLEGAGVLLALPAGRVRQTRSDPPLAFDGAAAPGCRLIDGPTRNLNVMVQRGSGVLRTVVPGVEWCEPFEARGLFALAAGTWRAAGGEAVPVAPFTLLWHEGGAPCRYDPIADDGGGGDAGPCGFWIGHSLHGAPGGPDVCRHTRKETA